MISVILKIKSSLLMMTHKVLQSLSSSLDDLVAQNIITYTFCGSTAWSLSWGCRQVLAGATVIERHMQNPFPRGFIHMTGTLVLAG